MTLYDLLIKKTNKLERKKQVNLSLYKDILNNVEVKLVSEVSYNYAITQLLPSHVRIEQEEVLDFFPNIHTENKQNQPLTLLLVNNNSDIFSLYKIFFLICHIERIYTNEKKSDDLSLSLLSRFIKQYFANKSNSQPYFIEHIFSKKGQLYNEIIQNYNIKDYLKNDLYGLYPNDYLSLFNINMGIPKQSKDPFELHARNLMVHNLIDYLSQKKDIEEQDIKIVQHIDKIANENSIQIFEYYKNNNKNFYLERGIEEIVQRAHYLSVSVNYEKLHNCIKTSFKEKNLTEILKTNNSPVDKATLHKNKFISWTAKGAIVTSTLLSLPLFLGATLYYYKKYQQEILNANQEVYKTVNQNYSFLNNNSLVFMKLVNYFEYLSEERQQDIYKLIQQYQSDFSTSGIFEGQIDNKYITKIENIFLSNKILINENQNKKNKSHKI